MVLSKEIGSHLTGADPLCSKATQKRPGILHFTVITQKKSSFIITVFDFYRYNWERSIGSRVDSPGSSPRVLKIPKVILKRVLCSPGSMFPGFYVPRVLYSPGSMFPGFYVPPGSIFPGFYIPRVLYSPGSMLPGFYIPQVLCSPGSIVPGFYSWA